MQLLVVLQGYNLRLWGDFIKNKPRGVLGIGCGKLGAERSRNQEQNEEFFRNLLGARSGRLGGRSGRLGGRSGCWAPAQDCCAATQGREI
ncbi:hypothetical protein AgCh_018161 [Apium graveolens]